ncbi:biliverdin-producing heme oxygenase [Rhodospirillum rubrum]|uniref:biliverdin-producing heme oxygenase n=1 Tax=Rhodospirillum rubrum TaxID=1085 RepID=UPI0019085999|nr:biliverdin-producing heme oxygenase [Rhodospirillum rubrum]MBK1663719.1 biliverdin-producing heme oxygenase [Rhodospirillum rubrum]MBK1676470.1 biliverdin-producing heme oxygenase [Rhodospirillum rubrum]
MSPSVETAPPRFPTGSAVAVLREETRGRHEGLHRHPLLAPLVDGDVEAEAYGRLLGCFLAFHRAAERLVLAPADAAFQTFGLERAPRLALIEADLASLAAAGVRVSPEPDGAEAWLPEAPGLAEAVGVLYVLEGSRLGGQGLANTLSRSDDPRIAAATAFLGSRDRAVGPLWRAITAMIETIGADPADRQRVTAAAKATFDALRRWLDTALVAKRSSQG